MSALPLRADMLSVGIASATVRANQNVDEFDEASTI